MSASLSEDGSVKILKHTSATSMADYVKALKASEFGGSKGHVKSRKARKALAIAA